MSNALVITDEQKNDLLKFLKKNRSADLVTIYLAFIEEKFHLQPVLYPRDKTIYQSLEDLIEKLEKQGKLWRETEITIQFGQQSVNEQTKKIYICPFTGKVFGDNTHPNPQDAIYDWVSKCPENKERVGGLPAKRFFVSEDPEVIKNYISERKASVKKVVYSSAITGKLFNSRHAVIEDFKKNYIKPLTMIEVQNQNRYQIDEAFLHFIEKHLNEEKIAAFRRSAIEASRVRTLSRKMGRKRIDVITGRRRSDANIRCCLFKDTSPRAPLIALSGDLGSGKTTFMQGLVARPRRITGHGAKPYVRLSPSLSHSSARFPFRSLSPAIDR